MSFTSNKPYNELPLLPPPRETIETISILKKESSARSALAELKGIAHLIPNQFILINALVLREARDSSEIENVITTQDKLYRALSTNIKKNDAETKEVLFYKDALLKGYRIIFDTEMFTVNNIIDVQQELIKNTAGFRKTSGTALLNDRTGEVIYTPPDDPDQLSRLITNMTEYFNLEEDNESILAKMAILHYQFESIHPFYDGNGRTGRILNILYLILKNLLDTPILYLSSYITQRKGIYYSLLRKVTREGAWEEWILFMLDAVEKTAQETINKIKQIKTLIDTTINTVKEKTPKIYSKELVESLFLHPYCKIEHIVKELGVERKAASRYLKELERIGILESKKIGPQKIFINTDLFNLLKE